MISGTYIISGVLLAISGLMFDKGHLDATTQTFCWIVIFFFASAGASAAYLTVSETWPIEIRIVRGDRGVLRHRADLRGVRPRLLRLADRRRLQLRTGLFIGYVIGGAIMILGGIVELAIGIKAEGKSLEAITKPITSTSEPATARHVRGANMDSYDVIIVGTGAGGGTLARHLAPSGKRILLLERGDWLPREPQNWSDQDVFVDNRYVSPDTWYDASGKSFQPGVHYYVGGATKLYGAALYRLRKEDFGELRHPDGISPAWPISYEGPGAVLRPRGAALPRARRPRRGPRPSLRRARPIHTPPCRTSRGSSSLPTTSRRPATSRSTRPAGSCSTSPTRLSASAFAARRVTASRASCTRSPTRRCSASGRLWSIRT